MLNEIANNIILLSTLLSIFFILSLPISFVRCIILGFLFGYLKNLISENKEFETI